jgi:hypothetical protein
MSQGGNSGRGRGGEAATASSTSLLERVKARDGEAGSKLCRLYFWRTVIDGQSSPQIAADLGLTPHAVRQATYRVLQRLRAELGDPQA